MGTPVRAKKAKKPAQSIRYLLSANPKFERISLKRLSKPVKSVRKRQPDRQADSTHASRVFVLAAMLVTTIGVLMAARGPSRQAGVATMSAQPKGSAPVSAAVVTNATALTNAAAKPDKTEARETPKPAATKAAVKNTSTVEPAKATAVESTPKTVESPAKMSPAESTEQTATSVQDPSSVTITGCLKFDEETFWLTDASGEDAVKSRSWKWGFLKKRSSNIELIDASHTLRLSNYVDQRVTATGNLTRHEMRAQSLQRVAGSCS